MNLLKNTFFIVPNHDLEQISRTYVPNEKGEFKGHESIQKAVSIGIKYINQSSSKRCWWSIVDHELKVVDLCTYKMSESDRSDLIKKLNRARAVKILRNKLKDI